MFYTKFLQLLRSIALTIVVYQLHLTGIDIHWIIHVFRVFSPIEKKPLTLKAWEPLHHTCNRKLNMCHWMHLVDACVFLYFQLFLMRLRPSRVTCLRPVRMQTSSSFCTGETQCARSRNLCVSTRGRGSCTLREERRTCSLLRYEDK